MYRLADLNIDIKGSFDEIHKLCAPFKCDSGFADIEITVTKEDVEKEKSFTDLKLTDAYLETVAACRLISEALPKRDAFLLHGAAIDVGGEGVVFLARSGTGKTTHLLRWNSLLGDRLTVINGDKPFVRFVEGEKLPFAYGTPWNGKEHLGNKGKTSLKHICFIERGSENKAEEIKKEEAADLLFAQVYMPKDAVSAANTLVLINRLTEVCEFWKITCNLDENAAEIPYKTIFER